MAEQHHHHLTVLSIPGISHLIPLLEFARRLVELHPSFHVTFLLLPNEAVSALLRSSTFPSSICFFDLPPLDIASFEPTDPLTLVILTMKATLPAIESFLVSKCQASKSKQIFLVDLFATEPLNIATKLSIPSYVFFPSTAQVLSFMLYLPVLDREVEGEFVDLQEPIQIPGCTPIHPSDIVQTVVNRKVSMYTSFLYHANQYSKADGIVLNSSPDLEPISIKALQEHPVFKQLKAPQVFPVGPIIRNNKSDTKHECITWLDDQPADSVVYVSFGSHGCLPTEQIAELAHGIELSEKRFIWVVKRAVEDVEEDGDPFVHLPEGFLERTSGRGMVVAKWAPQVDILSHAAVGGFLSHCGWNSTMESMVHGVPMLTWPIFAEQKMNAARLVNECGVAVRVAEMKKEEVERVVRLVIEGEEGKRLRGRARDMKKKVLRGLEEGGCSYNSFSQLVAEWMTLGAKNV